MADAGELSESDEQTTDIIKDKQADELGGLDGQEGCYRRRRRVSMFSHRRRLDPESDAI